MCEVVMRERGMLPSEWNILGFDEAAYTVTITDKKVKQQDYLKSGPLPVVDQGHVFVGGYTDDTSRLVECNLPVIVFGDHTRVLKYINFDFAAGADGIKVIKPIDAFDPKLFFYFLHVLDLPDRGYSRHFQFLRKERIPLPPLPEQYHIVAEIEKQFTRLDAGVAALKRVQTNLKRYRASVLKAACEGRLAPQDPNDEPADPLLARILAERRAKWESEHPGKKYVEPAAPETDGLPELPEGWCWTTMEQIADQRLGKMLDQVKNRGVLTPYFRNINVRWFRFDFSDIQEMRVTDEEIGDISVRVGDLVVCEGGEPGRATVWTSTQESMVIQKALHRVRPAQGISPWYLAYRLAADATNGKLESYFTGSTIKHFTGQSLRSYTFPLPPMKEQHRIVAEVERRLSVVAELEAAVAANLARAGRLRQAVLKRAFEGRLVAQDATSQPMTEAG